MRGKWILENLFGAPPPQPPANVETNLGEGEEIAKTTTLRQRLELHRASPVCASCHNIMDPMGFALENFDLIGTWREKDGPAKVDTSGRLADGTPLTGPADLRKAVLSRSDAFVTRATEKLFIYALGRRCTRSTCRWCAPSFAVPPGMATGSRRCCSGSSRAMRFRNA
jgi:hypothetical protein